MTSRLPQPHDAAAGDLPPQVPQADDPAVAWLLGRASAFLDGGLPDEALPYLERLLGLGRDREVLVWAHYALGEHWRERDELGRSTHHFRLSLIHI